MSLPRSLTPRLAEPGAVVAFWREAGPALWFAKDAGFDRAFRERFAAEHEAARRGRLAAWEAAAEGALALVLLLDQYPRNAFRGTPRMYATDEAARGVARGALAALDPPMRLFLVLPFGHSEDPADQERAVALAAGLPPPSPERARHHRDLVRRFGRFPHRNAILGRASTPEERAFLDAGGYAG